MFKVDLLKSQEINHDYILELLFEHNKKHQNKANPLDEVRRVIRARLGNPAKESLVIDFIHKTELDKLAEKVSVIEAFFAFAQAKLRREVEELIHAENLNTSEARRYITNSLKREYASDAGTDLNAILPKMSPLNPPYLIKKRRACSKRSLLLWGSLRVGVSPKMSYYAQRPNARLYHYPKHPTHMVKMQEQGYRVGRLMNTKKTIC